MRTGDRASYFWLYPNLMINCYAGAMDTNLVIPRGVDRTEVIFDYFFDDLSDAVDECLDHDLLVFSGGSSVGHRDLIMDVIAAKGEVLFHGIAVKPGKPTAFGRIGGKLFFGMPGYPTSCLSNTYMLLVPALRVHQSKCGVCPKHLWRRAAGAPWRRVHAPGCPRARGSRQSWAAGET